MSLSENPGFLADHIQHRIGVLEHIMIPEPDDADSETRQNPAALLVVGRLPRIAVLAAVQLDGEILLRAVEIQDVGTGRKLAKELESAKPPRAQLRPQPALRFGRAFPHLPRAGFQGRIGTGHDGHFTGPAAHGPEEDTHPPLRGTLSVNREGHPVSH